MTLAGNPTVRDLERELFERFPRSHAEEWDHCGLSVGDPSAHVGSVALALDPDAATVRAAAEAGCDALVTHHPVFLDPPELFGPSDAFAPDAGSAVFEAARQGVALLNYHTCLDRALCAQQRLPELLGLEYLHPLEGWSALAPQAHPQPGDPAYGAVCEAGEGVTLDALARRCADALGGRCPRVWGDGGREVHRVATCTGSISSLADDALAGGLDAVIVGEVRYHAAVDLSGRGLAVIELGHDVSELPLVDCLERALLDAGLPAERIVNLNRPPHWHSV